MNGNASVIEEATWLSSSKEEERKKHYVTKYYDPTELRSVKVKLRYTCNFELITRRYID